MPRLCPAPLALAVLASPTFAGVLVVAPAGPHTSIASAVGAAQNGDVILVKSGTYGGFTITGKSVVVVADAGAAVDVTGSVNVFGLGASQDCTLSGLRVVTPGGVASSVDVQACLGSVRIQDVIAQSTIVLCSGGGRAAHVAGSRDVVFTACELRGASAPVPSAFRFNPHSALVVEGTSRVMLHDDVVLGGNAGSGNGCLEFDDGFPGAPGIRDAVVPGGANEIWTAGSIVRGGNGGTGNDLQGNGGHGISLEAPGGGAPPVALHLLETQPQGGAAGGAGAAAGSPVQTSGVTPTVVNHSGTARTLAAPAVVRNGQTLTLSVQGVAGDVVGVFFAGQADWHPDPVSGWVRTVAGPHERFQRYGALPPSGVLDIPLTIPSQPSGGPPIVYHVQAVHRATNGVYFLGAPRCFVVLDPSY